MNIKGGPVRMTIRWVSTHSSLFILQRLRWINTRCAKRLKANGKECDSDNPDAGGNQHPGIHFNMVGKARQPAVHDDPRYRPRQDIPSTTFDDNSLTHQLSQTYHLE